MIADYKTYKEVYRNFAWDKVWDLFDGNPENFNIAYECIDRHRDLGTAVRIRHSDGRVEGYSFDRLSRDSSRFANALKRFGLQKNDRVAIMLEPSFEFYVALFGVLKYGGIVVPFYPLFGSEAIEFRLKDAEVRLMVANEDIKNLFDHTLVEQIVFVGEEFTTFISNEPEEYLYENITRGNDIAVYQYTSGTTRKFPEAVMHYHKSLAVLIPPAVFGIGLRRGDRYFCPSSPTWGHGLWYGTFAPLALGIAVGTFAGKYSDEALLYALEEFRINNLSAAPTIYRRLKNSSLIDHYDLKLDKLSYSMEPLDIDTFYYYHNCFNIDLCGLYGSTEVGVIIINFCGYEDYEVKPGSLGYPLPGLDVDIIDRKGKRLSAGEVGEIAVWRGNKWFRVKDAGYRDEDGCFWYQGRVDDIIISAGWTISPKEVEDVLQRHPMVMEAVVVGVSDPDRGQIVKAYLAVKNNDAGLIKDIQTFVKENLSKHEYPRMIELVESIPRTKGGKIDRRKLIEWPNQKQSNKFDNYNNS